MCACPQQDHPRKKILDRQGSKKSLAWMLGYSFYHFLSQNANPGLGGEKMQLAIFAFFLHFQFWQKVAFYRVFFCILMQLRRRKGKAKGLEVAFLRHFIPAPKAPEPFFFF